MDLREIGLRCGLDSSGSSLGPVAGSCERGNEPSDSKKDRVFLDYMSNYWRLKKDSAPWSCLVHNSSTEFLATPLGIQFWNHCPNRKCYLCTPLVFLVNETDLWVHHFNSLVSPRMKWYLNILISRYS
jgi:hypothetical protein